MLLLQDLCNRSPSICALVIWEETPSPLPVGFTKDSLLKFTRQHRVMVAPGYHLFLLLPYAGGPALPSGPFYLSISHQACVKSLLSRSNSI